MTNGNVLIFFNIKFNSRLSFLQFLTLQSLFSAMIFYAYFDYAGMLANNVQRRTEKQTDKFQWFWTLWHKQYQITTIDPLHVLKQSKTKDRD